MLVDPEMRGIAKKFFKQEVDVSLPEQFDVGTLSDDEIKEFFRKIKPVQYVAMARVIDPLVEIVTSTPLVPKTPNFKGLYNESQDCFSDAINEVEGSTVFQEAAEYPKMFAKLDPNKHMRLHNQLEGGAGTAANTMLGLMQELPGIIAHLAPGENLSIQDLHGIIKRSKRLAWRNAMMIPDRMSALQDTLFLDHWIDDEPNVIMHHFETNRIEQHASEYSLVRNGDGSIHSVDYVDVDNIMIPEGYEHRGPYASPEEDTPLKDLDFSGREAIGCPITLLKGRMEDLWFWYAEAVRQNGCLVNGEKANTRS